VWYGLVVEKRFQAVDDLIREIEAKSADETDTLALLVAVLKFVIQSEVDPYLLNGVLIESIANTVKNRVPGRRRQRVAMETVRLLIERLRAEGTI
jgi:hypothetical protein